jgi:hypothetical protein
MTENSKPVLKSVAHQLVFFSEDFAQIPSNQDFLYVIVAILDQLLQVLSRPFDTG